MKKTTLIAIVIAVLGFNALQGQEKGHFGLKVGLNISDLAVDGEKRTIDNRRGLHLGLVAEIPLSKKFAFQSELLYSSQGGRFEFSSNLNNDVYNVWIQSERVNKYDYLNIPLMLKHYIVKGLNVEFGPQIGFLLSAKSIDKSKFASDRQTTNAFDDRDIKNAKSIDFGLNFGTGYQWDMGLFFQARYNLGLSDVYDGRLGDAKAKNRVVSLSMGYRF